jgi:hypothetical protein
VETVNTGPTKSRAHPARVPWWPVGNDFNISFFRRLMKDGGTSVFGGTPKTARGTRALPKNEMRPRINTIQGNHPGKSLN